MKQNFLILLSLFLLLELYIYQAFKTIISSPAARWGYCFITLLVYASLFFALFNLHKSLHSQHIVQLVIGTFLIFILPKLLVALFLIFDDILRLFSFGFEKLHATPAHSMSLS